MKILILGGFLGSGKTSLLLDLVKHIVGPNNDPSNVKVAIIENEIGEVGVDDVTLKSTGLQVENMSNGCICCSLAGQMVPALIQLREDYDPEWVIVEATGVANPISVSDTITGTLTDIATRIVTIVDAKRWPRLIKALEHILVNQLDGAQTVLINKVDLVSEEEAEDVAQGVQRLRPEARIFKVSAQAGVDAQVWRAVLGED